MIEQFNFIEHDFQGLIEIQPFFATDSRGHFIKDYDTELFSSQGIDHPLKEIFYSKSSKGVLRGLHFQRVQEQAKLVRCITGHIFDVVVDLRQDSPTFKKYKGFDLKEENRASLLIPEGFAHGFLALEDSLVSYKCNERFHPDYDSGVKWNDPDLGIDWPLDKIGGASNLIISEKDKNLWSFSQFKEKYGWF